VRRHYAPDIKEILVSGDLAAVRVRHLKTRRTGGPKVETTEPGLDLFRREPDGSWRIIRFLAYEAPLR
jgi:ketosteroid isomerase-like protein